MTVPSLNVVGENLKELLTKHPFLKDNYNKLCVYYWVSYDGVKTLKDIALATPSETITRSFRDLVSRGFIEPSKKVKDARKKKEQQFRSKFSKRG